MSRNHQPVRLLASSLLSILRQKKGGHYVVLLIDPAYEPPALQERTVFGFVLRQDRNSARLTVTTLPKPQLDWSRIRRSSICLWHYLR
jgi:hypothetical protein